ncbi:hypothetical protein IG631_23898 [Alternaria alternata]|nr:hypothetical protein IG631_23898 [Alternaria alternata]
MVLRGGMFYPRGGRLDVDDLDLERVSSSSTAFEDIEAYSEPVETMLGDYLDIEDDVSVASARTV